MRRFPGMVMIFASLGWMAGCVTVGRPFPADFVSKITIGQTTRPQVEQRLGAPFRTGNDSGNPTATYLHYRLGVFSQPLTKDLTITYGADGKVKGFTFSANQPDESEAAE